MIADKRSAYVRMYDDLYDKLKEIADLEKRSFNAQVEYFLEKSAEEYMKKREQQEEQS